MVSVLKLEPIVPVSTFDPILGLLCCSSLRICFPCVFVPCSMLHEICAPYVCPAAAAASLQLAIRHSTDLKSQRPRRADKKGKRWSLGLGPSYPQQKQKPERSQVPRKSYQRYSYNSLKLKFKQIAIRTGGEGGVGVGCGTGARPGVDG